MDIQDLIDELQGGGADAQALIEVLADLLRSDGKSQFIRDSAHAVQTRVLADGVTVTADASGIGRDVIGTSQFDTYNFLTGGGAVRVNADNPRQVDIPRGAGGGADCMFDYLVSGCFATLSGFTEGQAFTSLSGCIFYGYSTVQGAVDAAIATATKKVIYICGGTYAETVTIDVGGNHPDRQPDLIGAGNDRTFINSIYIRSGGNSNSGWDIFRDFGLKGDGTRIFRTEKPILGGFNAGDKLKCQNITFGVTGGLGGEIYIAVSDISFWEGCEFRSATEWFNCDGITVHACRFTAPVTISSGSGSVCNNFLWTNSAFIDAKISIPGSFAQGLRQGSFVNNRHSVTTAATAAFEIGASGTTLIQELLISASTFYLDGGTITAAWINVVSAGISSISENSISITGNGWQNPGVPFVKSADADLDTVVVVGNTQQQSAAGLYLENSGGFTVSGNFNNSVFGLNAPGQVTNYSLTGQGNTVEGIGQVTAAPAYGAAEGSLAFDKTANVLYVNIDGGTTWSAIGTGGGGGASTSEPFVTIGSSAGLTNEYPLTAGTGITLDTSAHTAVVSVTSQIKEAFVSFGAMPTGYSA